MCCSFLLSLLSLTPWNLNFWELGDDITYSPQDSIFRKEKICMGGKKTDFLRMGKEYYLFLCSVLSSLPGLLQCDFLLF